MSHKTRVEAGIRELKARGLAPNDPEAIAFAARMRASRYVHPRKPTLIDTRREVEEAVKKRVDEVTPMTAYEAIALLLKICWQGTVVSAYLFLLPWFRVWRWIKSKRKQRAA